MSEHYKYPKNSIFQKVGRFGRSNDNIQINVVAYIFAAAILCL